MSFPKNDVRQRMEGRTITTLRDYIKQKSDGPSQPKLSFDDWWQSTGRHLHVSDSTSKELMMELWDIAQANK